MEPNNKAGIYRILNIVNCKQYIGSTQNIEKRWSEHRVALKRGNHHSLYLQHAWNKYHEESFKFEVILYCSQDKLLHYEQEFLNEMRPEYNIALYANHPTKGRKMDQSFCKKLSLLNSGINHPQYGKPKSEETKKKLSLANLGKKMSIETIAKRTISQTGRKVSDEIKRRIGQGNRGKIRSEETRRKLSESHKGYKPSISTIEKRRATRAGYHHSKETIEKISIANKGHSVSKETKEKLSRAVKRLWEDRKYIDRGLTA